MQQLPVLQKEGKQKKQNLKRGNFKFPCALRNLWNCYEKILERQEVRCWLPDGSAQENIWECSALTYNNLEKD